MRCTSDLDHKVFGKASGAVTAAALRWYGYRRHQGKSGSRFGLTVTCDSGISIGRSNNQSPTRATRAHGRTDADVARGCCTSNRNDEWIGTTEVRSRQNTGEKAIVYERRDDTKGVVRRCPSVVATKWCRNARWIDHRDNSRRRLRQRDAPNPGGGTIAEAPNDSVARKYPSGTRLGVVRFTTLPRTDTGGAAKGFPPPVICSSRTK